MSNLRTIDVEWQGGMRFQGTGPGGAKCLVDADGKDAVGPMLMLLLAAAGCTGADVVSILEKMQVKLRKYRMQLKGLRAEDHPKRYLSIHLAVTMAGDGLDEAKARRAIELSLGKYLWVMKSLAPDTPVTYDLTLEA